MARITGPGTVPLYVQAGKKTPGAISISSSVATSVYSRTRPGLCGQRARRVEQRVEVVRTADRGRALTDHRSVPRRRVAGMRGSGAMRGVVVPAASASPPRMSCDPDRHGRERRRRAEEPPSGEFRHA